MDLVTILPTYFIPYVCLSVCLCVCLFTFEVQFKRFLSPLPKVRCPNNLEIRSPWGKVMERSGLRFENFYYYYWLLHMSELGGN